MIQQKQKLGVMVEILRNDAGLKSASEHVSERFIRNAEWKAKLPAVTYWE